MKRIILLVKMISFLAVMLASVGALAAEEFYMQIEGSVQGVFKGDSKRSSHKGWITALDIQHHIGRPRDPTSGLPAGAASHNSIGLTKRWSIASPQIIQAMLNNETLTTVILEFFAPNEFGVDEVYYRIRLTNATISSVKTSTNRTNPNAILIDGSKATSDVLELETFELVYEQIEWQHIPGGTAAAGSW